MTPGNRDEIRSISQIVAGGALSRVVAKVATESELVDALAFIVLCHELDKLGVTRPAGVRLFIMRLERLAALDCEAYQTALKRMLLVTRE